MTDRDVIRRVDDGANFYLRFFGSADHMEYHENDYYSYIQPKQGEHGVTFVFNITLEGLSESKRLEIINEIKSLKMPVWWSLQSSDELYKSIHGADKVRSTTGSPDGGELYMAILKDEPITSASIPENMTISKVADANGFRKWANAVNEILNGGYNDIHPINHYIWCQNGLLNCFSCYCNDAVVAVASILNNDGICSLEFVATDPSYRRCGLAKAVCAAAMNDAFHAGAKIITLRAINPGTRELYTSLGYKIYDSAL